MEVYGRENGGGVFLWLVSNIKVLVTASYVMGKCRTGVFVSVFCDYGVAVQRDNFVGQCWVVVLSRNTHVYPYLRGKSV